MFTILAWVAWGILFSQLIGGFWYVMRYKTRWWIPLMRLYKDPDKLSWLKVHLWKAPRLLLIFAILGTLYYFNTAEDKNRVQNKAVQNQTQAIQTAAPIAPLSEPDAVFPFTVTEVTTTTENKPELQKIPQTTNFPTTGVPGTVTVSQTTKQEDFKKLFVTETNVIGIKMFAALAFSVLAALVLSIPFMNLQEFSFLGFGYKRALDQEEANKVRKVAGYQYEMQEMMLQTKTSFLLTLNSDVFYREIISNYVRPDGTIQEFELLSELAKLIKDVYWKGLLLNIQTDVMRVQGWRLAEQDVQAVKSIELQQTLQTCVRNGLPVYKKGETSQSLVIPIPYSAKDTANPNTVIGDAEFCLFYLHTEDPDAIITEMDADWIRLAWTITHGSSYLMVSQYTISYLEERLQRMA